MAISAPVLEIGHLARRDESAFNRLVEAYRPLIERWVHRYGIRSTDADEVVQEVLLAAWSGCTRLRSTDALAGWLKTITDNACKKWIRTRVRKPSVPVGLNPDPSASYRPAGIEQSMDIEEALSALPAREADVLRLLYAEDLPLDEAAAALQISVEATKSLAARARRRFRDRFESWFRVPAFLPLAWRRLSMMTDTLGEGGRALAGSVAAATGAASVGIVLAAVPGQSPAPVPDAPAPMAATVDAGPAVPFESCASVECTPAFAGEAQVAPGQGTEAVNGGPVKEKDKPEPGSSGDEEKKRIGADNPIHSHPDNGPGNGPDNEPDGGQGQGNGPQGNGKPEGAGPPDGVPDAPGQGGSPPGVGSKGNGNEDHGNQGQGNQGQGNLGHSGPGHGGEHAGGPKKS